MRIRAAVLIAVTAAVAAAPPAVAARGSIRNVQAHDSYFSPTPITVRTGSRVRWTNVGRLPHTTTSSNGLWDDTMAPGETFVRRFSSPGTFGYRCTIHRGMTGTVTVTS